MIEQGEPITIRWDKPKWTHHSVMLTRPQIKGLLLMLDRREEAAGYQGGELGAEDKALRRQLEAIDTSHD